MLALLGHKAESRAGDSSVPCQSLIKDWRFIQNAHVQATRKNPLASQLHEMETRYSFQQDPRQAELPATIANYSHKMGVM